MILTRTFLIHCAGARILIVCFLCRDTDGIYAYQKQSNTLPLFLLEQKPNQTTKQQQQKNQQKFLLTEL